MGLNFIDMALCYRYSRHGFNTVWGWLFSGLAVLVWFFGSDERRHSDDEETAARRRRANDISRIVAGALFVLAVILDVVLDN